MCEKHVLVINEETVGEKSGSEGQCDLRVKLKRGKQGQKLHTSFSV